mmetsp:Transcript_28299/g.45849  ORF Transcript_28299/g.45849 Transcript_28299/m.45849 type:complete len:362 (+) Transcript_28299:156-1241(+)
MDPEVILVTGGLGFLGKHVVDALLNDKEHAIKQVRVFDLRKESFKDPRVVSIAGDLRNRDDVFEAIKGVDAVIHVASAPYLAKDKKFLYAVNVQGAQNVIDACKEFNVQRLVYTSSASVIFAGTDQEYVDETVPYPTKFREIYAETKAVAEKLIIRATGQKLKDGRELLTCALRPHGIFGEGDQLMVPQIVARAKRNKMKYAIGSGQNLVDFTYVGNVADAHVLALFKLFPKSCVCGQIYFITNDEPILFWDFIGSICTGLGYEGPKVFLPYRLMLVIAWIIEMIAWVLSPIVTINPVMNMSKIQISGTAHYYNVSKAKRDLGYVPKVSVHHGVERLLAHFSNLGKNGSTDKTPLNTAPKS